MDAGFVVTEMSTIHRGRSTMLHECQNLAARPRIGFRRAGRHAPSESIMGEIPHRCEHAADESGIRGLFRVATQMLDQQPALACNHAHLGHVERRYSTKEYTL